MMIVVAGASRRTPLPYEFQVQWDLHVHEDLAQMLNSRTYHGWPERFEALAAAKRAGIDLTAIGVEPLTVQLLALGAATAPQRAQAHKALHEALVATTRAETPEAIAAAREGARAALVQVEGMLETLYAGLEHVPDSTEINGSRNDAARRRDRSAA
jgi:hypothetical protein